MASGSPAGESAGLQAEGRGSVGEFSPLRGVLASPMQATRGLSLSEPMLPFLPAPAPVHTFVFQELELFCLGFSVVVCRAC